MFSFSSIFPIGTPCWWAFSDAGILVANSMCATGEAAAPTRVICAKESSQDDGGQYCLGFGSSASRNILINRR